MSEQGAQGGRQHEEDYTIHLFLAYFGLFSLIPFLVFRNKRSDSRKDFVYWHARQGLALAIVVMCLHVAVTAALLLLSNLPGIGSVLEWVLWAALILFTLGFTVSGWVSAFTGRRWKMPLVGRLSEMLG